MYSFVIASFEAWTKISRIIHDSFGCFSRQTDTNLPDWPAFYYNL